MTATATLPNQRRNRVLIWGALAALVLHLLIFAMPLKWLLPRLPGRVEISSISPSDLNALRQKWNTRQRALYIPNSQDTAPELAPDPAKARYESDRNRRVEKETRASSTTPVVGDGNTKKGERSRAKRHQQQSTQTLEKLGVALPKPSKENSSSGDDADDLRSGLGPGAEQALHDANLTPGARNVLNTVQSKYYSFYSRVYEAIAPVWESRIRSELTGMKMKPGSYVTAMEFVLDEDGTVIETRVLESAGVPQFDRTADYAIRKIGRFRNPPAGLVGPDGKTHIQFSFSVDLGEGGVLDLFGAHR